MSEANGRARGPRSDAPGFNVWSGESVTTIRTADFSIGIGVSNSVDNSVSVGVASEPLRRAAPKATRSARSSHSAVWNRLDRG